MIGVDVLLDALILQVLFCAGLHELLPGFARRPDPQRAQPASRQFPAAVEQFTERRTHRGTRGGDRQAGFEPDLVGGVIGEFGARLFARHGLGEGPILRARFVQFIERRIQDRIFGLNGVAPGRH